MNTIKCNISTVVFNYSYILQTLIRACVTPHARRKFLYDCAMMTWRNNSITSISAAIIICICISHTLQSICARTMHFARTFALNNLQKRARAREMRQIVYRARRQLISFRGAIADGTFVCTYMYIALSIYSARNANM